MSKTKNPQELVFLVVDDDSQVRDILIQYLTSFGYQNVLDAKDGKTAMKIIQNEDQPIDIVISDWEMPYIDGLTLLKAIRKDPHRKHVKFIMVSSQGSHERMKISKAAKSKVDAYIVKPFRANILKDKIGILIKDGFDPSAKEFEQALLGNISEDEIKDDEGEAGGGITVDKMLQMVKVAIQEKNYTKALELCSETANLFPTDADVYFHLGQIYDLSQKPNDALQYLRQAIKLKAYHVGAHTLMNDILARLEKAKAS